MRWNRSLTVGAAVSALALMVASAHAQSAAPAKPGVAADFGRIGVAISKRYRAADLAGHHYVESAEAWAEKDTAAAGRSIAAAARYVKDALGKVVGGA